MDRRRKFWGWGFRASSRRGGRGREPPRPGRATISASRPPRSSGPLASRTSRLPPSADRAARLARAHLRRPIRTSAPRTLRQGLPRRRPRLPGALRPPARRRRPPARRGRGRGACSTGARAPAPRRSRSAAARAWSAASSRASADRAGAVTIDLGALDRVLEVDARLARRADRGRRARPRARGPARARTGSRCATSRSRSSSRRSAAGSRRVRAATSRRSTRTSTISSSRSARHAARRLGDPPPPRLGRRARARTGCSSARRARSA